MTENRACKRCWYWVEGANGVTGECRRKPPVHDFDNLMAEFPRTNSDSWCGEYRHDARKDDAV